MPAVDVGYSVPPWSAYFQTGRVTGRFADTSGAPLKVRDANGNLVNATLTFTPDAKTMIVPSDGLTVVSSPVLATLDNNGQLVIELPACDDPDVRPIKWTYTVTENWPGGRTYHMRVLMGVTVNLIDVAPVQPSIGLMRYIGPPGGGGGGGGPGGTITATETSNGDLTTTLTFAVTGGISVSAAENGDLTSTLTFGGVSSGVGAISRAPDGTLLVG